MALIPTTEREALEAVMRQAEADLAAAHAEICRLQGLDAAQHTWPEWSSPANTLRWFVAIRERFSIAAEQPDFTYYECPECGFDCIHRADYEPRSTACPLCAGDSGHDVGMISRTARTTDKPEGKDARTPTPEA